MKTYTRFFLLLLSFILAIFFSCTQKEEREKGKLYAVLKKNYWGYEDHNGNVVIDYKFDLARPFVNNRAIVLLNDKYQIIDETGRSITKQYKDLDRVNDKYFLGGEYGERELIDLQGKVIADSLNSAHQYIIDTNYVVLEKRWRGEKGYNIIDNNGKQLLPIWVNAVGVNIFRERFFGEELGPGEKSKAFPVSFDNNGKTKYAYVSDKMKLITDTIFDDGVSMRGGYGYLSKETRNKRESDYYIFDSLGNNVCKIRANKILDVIPAYKLVTVEIKNNHYVYNLVTGEKISGPFRQIGEGSKFGGWGVSFGGSSVISVTNKTPDYSGFSDGFILFYKTISKGGYIDSTGKVAIAPTFEAVFPFTEGLACVRRFNRSKLRMEYGFINTKGELVVPYKYSFVQAFKDGMAEVEQADGTKLKIDKTGKEIK